MKIFKFPFTQMIFLFIFLSGYISAQEVSKNFFGLSFGGSDFHIKDYYASPLIFRKVGIAPTLQYLYRGEKNRHYFEGSYYDYDLATSADNFHTINRSARIRYSYLHSITHFNVFKNKINLFLGGSAGTYLCHSDYYYKWNLSTDARSLESWYWCNSLDLSGQLEYSSSPREFLSFQFFIPVISNVSRPQYSTTADYNYVVNDWKYKMFGSMEFFPGSFSINTILTYQRPIILGFNLQVSYEFYYSLYKEPKGIDMYMNNLRAGLFYCF